MKMRSLRLRRTRQGFTLVEIMVVMTIIALLIAILVPAAGFVREQARGTQCKSSLRQFYLGFAGNADKNKDGKYTTGAFDWYRDGCPDSVGWVADMVNSKVCKPQELLCPTNPAQGCEKLKDLVGTVTGAAGENAPAAKQQLSVCGNSGGAATLTAADVADQFLAKGYGTNHMTTWFLSRSSPQVTGTGVTTGGTVTAKNVAYIKSLNGSKGPLKRRTVDTSPVTANVIPFAGDSAFGDVADRFVEEDIVGSDGTMYLTAGSPLAESFSDGPYVSGNNGTTYGPWKSLGTPPTIYGVTISGTTVTYSGIASKEQPTKGSAKLGNTQLDHLQDYRDFGPVHGGSANVLFADGSVKVFQDLNGDTFLNPGFMTTAGAAVSGYSSNDNTVELPEAEIFSGILIENFNITTKGKLD